MSLSVRSFSSPKFDDIYCLCVFFLTSKIITGIAKPLKLDNIFNWYSPAFWWPVLPPYYALEAPWDFLEMESVPWIHFMIINCYQLLLFLFMILSLHSLCTNIQSKITGAFFPAAYESSKDHIKHTSENKRHRFCLSCFKLKRQSTTFQAGFIKETRKPGTHEASYFAALLTCMIRFSRRLLYLKSLVGQEQQLVSELGFLVWNWNITTGVSGVICYTTHN